MSKETSVIALGIWTIIIPFLGLPESWRIILFILSGLGLIVVGFLLRAEALSRGAPSSASRPFVENNLERLSDIRPGASQQQENLKQY